uniref:Uncharacterized protein n=1 Tax=Capra hircus TaxID=9925 RepID=A0A8C2RPF7_CAPHI
MFEPLILHERYVDSSPLLQQRLLALMDSWCQPGFDIRVVARQYPQATLRLERLSPRALGRQVLRLLEQYRLGPALCPNVVTQQRLAALRYLCYKRLEEVRGPGRGGGSSERGLLSAPGAAYRKAHTGVHFCREAYPGRAGLSWCR